MGHLSLEGRKSSRRNCTHNYAGSPGLTAVSSRRTQALRLRFRRSYGQADRELAPLAWACTGSGYRAAVQFHQPLHKH